MNKITNASRFLFEELVSRIQERSNAVGIAVAIVDRNGNTQYEKFFGYRDQERKLPIDEDTIFGLASVTKSFVALSIMQLVEAGKVDLDDPVSKYIPEFTNRNQKPIKLWHFLCHTAGFYPMHRTIINEIAQKAGLDENETSKRYMHHYNFPSYSVGETKPSRGPGRREIGHGALAERALVPVLPTAEEFPYAIRTVSETMESNGSTSQASICASTLSLMAAGVPIKAPVAGISCGLVTGDTDDDYIVLTDIQGLEDFFGDMDFKVGGTHKGITSIQMDIKIHGLTRPIIEEAIAKTREARLYILDEVMAPVISEPRKTVSQYAPKIVQISIDPQKIGDVVGKQGKVINKIIEQTGVKIDIEDDGSVSVCGTDQAMIDKAVSIIKGIVTDIEPGQILTGTVVRIMNFGAFVELAPNKDGMVHISKLSDKRVAKVEDVVNIGDEVTVRVVEVDRMGRINLTMRPEDMTADLEKLTRPERRERSDRPERRDDRRGGRRDDRRERSEKKEDNE